MKAAEWAALPMLSFDLETTGIDVHNDRIVTASLVRYRPDRDLETYSWLIDPGIEIPDEAAQVHGVTTEHARQHGVDPGTAVDQITSKLAAWMSRSLPTVIYNAAYDLSLLEAENRRHGLPQLAELLAPRPIGPILDPFVIDKHVDKWRKGKRQLAVTCGHYGVDLEAAHTSDADADAARLLMLAIAKKHAYKLRGLSIGQLHQQQIEWRAEQQDSLRDYFDKNGTEHDGCDGTWPVMREPQTLGAAVGSLADAWAADGRHDDAARLRGTSATAVTP